MEKVGEDEEKTIEEANNSTEETKSDKEEERIKGTIADQVDPVDSTEEGSTGPSNSHTVVSKDHDFSESDMEDEEQVLEFFRRNHGFSPEVTKRNNFPYVNNSERMVLQFQEDTSAETEQTNEMFHSLNDSNEILEGTKSSSASDEDTEDSSSNSDLDSSLSRYYFDGSLPVSAHVEEFETHQDESLVPKDENQMPLLCLKQPMLQPTSWRNCCGLLELLWAADP
ncbi:hypothetical protein AT2G42860 [Arabidopsis thaliana]|uniref:Expressed protein n=1 Tax=Arabidopsis thaliana TaxID=3702 RepID=Q9SJH1_ARATH|nr:uncharacterized protein AT2G42860 [Arabidopsis thaliana]AAD21723.2 expressed protein [Arabidopsis thaliana]AEC10178.1 hypothetical protein AT2G42860 [Arabidopsis thaliana]|eukprot:NP_565987.1 hypothetical protein AT2G42860 [Arabidopsis thaliana]